MAEHLFFENGSEEPFYLSLAGDPDSKTLAGSSRSPGHGPPSSGSGRLLDIATDPEALITEQLSLQHAQPYSESVSERPVPDVYIGDSTNVHMDTGQGSQQGSSDTNMEFHHAQPQTVRDSTEVTSPRNSAMIPASLSVPFQSDPHLQEQIQFGRNTIPSVPTMPSPCSDVDDVFVVKSDTGNVVTYLPLAMEDRGSDEATANPLSINHYYLCQLCGEKRINAMLMPCRHAGLCMRCACSIKHYSKTCPFCHYTITDVESVFLP